MTQNEIKTNANETYCNYNKINVNDTYCKYKKMQMRQNALPGW